MTYCVGIKLNQGLVLLADTRTNAGVDNISKVKKLFTWQVPGERVLAMMTAGNLAITQAVISEINERLDQPNPNEPTIFSAQSMFEVAQVVGDTMRKVQARYGPGLAARNVESGATILLAGQRVGGIPRMFLVYAAGNFIETTEDSPFFQLGEHKYGKPILDRVISVDTEIQDGIICALLSMDSTMRSNLTVGMPLDLCVIRTNSIMINVQRRIEADDPKFFAFSDAWSNALKNAFYQMRMMDV